MELTTRLRAGFPNNPTPRKRLVEWRGRTLRGHHPLRHAHHSRGISGATRHRERFARLQFRGKPRIFKLGSSRFARRYSENPGWFLFLRLVICLNSAGNLDRLEANGEVGGRRPRERPIGPREAIVTSELAVPGRPLGLAAAAGPFEQQWQKPHARPLVGTRARRLLFTRPPPESPLARRRPRRDGHIPRCTPRRGAAGRVWLWRSSGHALGRGLGRNMRSRTR
jgi:hypothetical protein